MNNHPNSIELELEFIGSVGTSLINIANELKNLKDRNNTLNSWACIMCFQLQFNLTQKEIREYAIFVSEAQAKGWITYSYSGYVYDVVFVTDTGLMSIETPLEFMQGYRALQDAEQPLTNSNNKNI